jgi:hypothetical protein
MMLQTVVVCIRDLKGLGPRWWNTGLADGKFLALERLEERDVSDMVAGRTKLTCAGAADMIFLVVN